MASGDIDLVNFTGKDTGFTTTAKNISNAIKTIEAAAKGLNKVSIKQSIFKQIAEGSETGKVVGHIKTVITGIDHLGRAVKYTYTRLKKESFKNAIMTDLEVSKIKDNTGEMKHILKSFGDEYAGNIRDAKKQRAKDLKDQEAYGKGVVNQLNSSLNEQKKTNNAAEREAVRNAKALLKANNKDRLGREANAATGGLVQQMGGIGPLATSQGRFNVASARNQLNAIMVSGNITEARMREIFNAIRTNATVTLDGLTTAERAAELGMRRLQKAMENLNTAGKRTQDVMISWQGIMRIFAVQQLHRIIGVSTTEFWKSADAAKELSIKIGQIQSISQSAQKTTESWSASLTGLSNKFGISTLDAAAAAYESISNQMGQGAAVLPFLSESFQFAKVTAASAEQSLNLLSAALNSYGQSTIHVSSTAASLFKLIDLGRVKAGDLANTFGNTTALAHSLGVSLNELNAGIATLTINGIRSDTAMTLMNNIFLKLTKPSKEMNELFHEWGVASGEAAISTFGFVGVLQKLEAEMSKGGASRIAELFPDMRALRGITGLTGGSAFAKYNETFKKMTESTLEYDQAIEIASKTIGQRFNIAVVKMNNSVRQHLGEPIIKHFVEWSEAVADLSVNLNDFFDGMINTVKMGIDASRVFFNLASIFNGTSGGVMSFAVLLPAVTAALITFNIATVIASINLKGFVGTLTAMRLGFLALSGPIGIAAAAIGGTLAAAYAIHLQALNNVSNAIIDIENKLAESNTKYSEKIVKNLKTTSDALNKSLDEQRQKFNLLINAFELASRASIPVKSKSQQSITDAIFDEALGSSSGTDKIALLHKRLKEAVATTNQFKFAKQFEDAEKSMETVVEHALDINKEISSMIQKITGDITSLQDQKAENNFASSLLGLSDTKKAKKIGDEINKLVAESDQLFAGNNFEEGNKRLERANDLVKELISTQTAIKEEYGGTATRNNIGGFNVQDIISDKQIAAQKQLAEFLKAQRVDVKKDHESELVHLEKMVKAQEDYKQAVIESGLAIQDLKAQLADIEGKRAASESTARGGATNVVAGVEQFLRAQSNLDPYTSALPKEEAKAYEQMVSALRQQKIELEALMEAEADPTIIKAKIEQVRRAFASVYVEAQEIAGSKTLGAKGETMSGIVNSANSAFDMAQAAYANLTESQALHTKISQQITQGTAELAAYVEKFRGVLNTAFSGLGDSALRNKESIDRAATAMERLGLAAKSIVEAVGSQTGIPIGNANGGRLGFAPGGMLGGGLGRDNQAFMGHAGEFVMNAESSKKFAPQLTAMNSGYTNSISNSRTSTVSVGDVHVHANVQGGRIDAQSVGHQLRRELRRGTVKWN